jgi:hypothetical protein
MFPGLDPVKIITSGFDAIKFGFGIIIIKSFYVGVYLPFYPGTGFNPDNFSLVKGPVECHQLLQRWCDFPDFGKPEVEPGILLRFNAGVFRIIYNYQSLFH